MKIASVFSSHMVLQRDLPLPVWGWSLQGDTITIEFAGQKKTATPRQDGKWTATLDPLQASAEGRSFTIHSASENRTETFKDVLVGEVWLASGQSNMEWPVLWAADATAEIAAADHPQIRLFTVPPRMMGNPPQELNAEWKICSPVTISYFSASAYYFGRKLNGELGVPVGLIHSSKGGTRIEAWTSRDALVTETPGLRAVEEYEKGPSDPAQRGEWEEYAKDRSAWFQKKVVADPGNNGFEARWAKPGFDDAGWDEMETPSKWQGNGHAYSGVFWFRRTIDIPDAWVGKDLVLQLGACDKHDDTYFNNVHVGAIAWEVQDAWCTPRVYSIPAGLVRPGRNVIATRIYSYMTDGGLIGPADAMKIYPEDCTGADPIRLTGAWKYKVEHNFGPQPTPVDPLGPGNPNTPCILFDNMIQPLAPCAVRGAIWYQGESNAGAPADYRKLFPLMIRNWRQVFKQPELPFLFVQLANYMETQQDPSEQSNWAELREAQTMTLREPGTGMAVAIDIGDGKDIHPKNKQDVGARLALAALAQVYGRAIEFSGPLYRSHAVEGNSVRLHFDHATGLKTSDGAAPKAFAIAGSDRKFHWTVGHIDGETIVLQSDAVSAPVAVRYAWNNNPPVNLCNAAGLPASPFRAE